MSCRALMIGRSSALSSRLGSAFDASVELVRWVPPEAALQALRDDAFDLVLLEVEPPPSALLRVVELIMAERPLPIVLLASAANRQLSFPLLAAGALEALELPVRVDEAFQAEFHRQLLFLATIQVVRHPRGHRRRSSASRLTATRPAYPLVAVAASLGGPRALAELLSDLPDDFGAPVVVCQHITPGFSGDLAQWLGAETGLRVHEASEGQPLVKGEVFIAPANRHLVVLASGLLRCEDSAPVGGFRPSCDVLLRTAAGVFGSRAIGVVLTGMGRDGARGLLEVKEQGGHTVAQDEASCAVFGMPREAIALGAAEMVLPLAEIGAQLSRWVL